MSIKINQYNKETKTLQEKTLAEKREVDAINNYAYFYYDAYDALQETDPIKVLKKMLGKYSNKRV